jgi:hypothetical protein
VPITVKVDPTALGDLVIAGCSRRVEMVGRSSATCGEQRIGSRSKIVHRKTYCTQFQIEKEIRPAQIRAPFANKLI